MTGLWSRNALRRWHVMGCAGRKMLIGVALTMATAQAGAAIVVEQTVTGTTNSGTSVVSASITGGTDHLYLAAISTKSYRDVSTVTGLGLTWTRVGEQCGGRNQTNTEVWMAQGAATSGTVTATIAGSSAAVVISVSRLSGVDAVDPIGVVVQENTNGVNGACSGGTDSSPYSLALTTTINDTMLYGAVGKRQRTHTPGSGFTELSDVSTALGGGSDAGVATEWKTQATAGATVVDGTLSSDTDWGAVAIEILPPSNTAPSAPSALGPPARVDGSASIDHAPTLNFTQSDTDSGDLLSYRIQIDDDSDFTSPTVDYTSGAAAQGATSFTVGQAAGSGTYAVGASGQELPRSTFYWRVRSDDGTVAGDWAVVNGGAVAFTVGLPVAGVCP